MKLYNFKYDPNQKKLYTIKEYECEIFDEYTFQVFDGIHPFLVLKSEVDVMLGNFMYSLSKDPTLFLKELINFLERNIEYHKNTLERKQKEIKLIKEFLNKENKQ